MDLLMASIRFGNQKNASQLIALVLVNKLQLMAPVGTKCFS